MTFEIKRAVREATPALLGLWGPSGSGKTYTGLLIARGLIGPKGKIVVIDTENGRAKFYADLVGGWEHLDLQPPFSPDRYVEAIAAATAAGAKAILVDSTSHCWQGEGGTLDMADSGKAKGLAKWKAPKTAYMRMMNAMLRAPVHVIFCMRAKEKFVQVGKGDNAEIINQGLVPIMQSQFIYELTVAVQLSPETHAPIAPIKCPEALMKSFTVGKMLTEDTGREIATWIGGGAKVDTVLTEMKRVARERAAEGGVTMRTWWDALPKDDRKRLAPMLDELRGIAAQADEDAAQPDGVVDTDPLNDDFTPPKTTAGPQPEGTPVPPADVTAPQSSVTKAPTAEPPATKSEPTADELWGLSKARFPTPIRQHDEIIRKINEDAKTEADIDAILATNKTLMAGIAKDMGNTAIREIEAAAAKRKKEPHGG